MNRLLSAPEPLVHSVLVALCDNERIQKRALKYLATLEDYAADISADVGPGEDSGGGSSSTATTTTTTTTKPRKRKMMATAPAQLCIMCKGAFSPGDNSPTACAYHDGDLGVDDDSAVWADWDEDVGGPRETSENEEDHPHAFTWCKNPFQFLVWARVSGCANVADLFSLCSVLRGGWHEARVREGIPPRCPAEPIEALPDVVPARCGAG